jgi:hypothetical protein
LREVCDLAAYLVTRIRDSERLNKEIEEETSRRSLEARHLNIDMQALAGREMHNQKYISALEKEVQAL